jgi:hypothetical protein
VVASAVLDGKDSVAVLRFPDMIKDDPAQKKVDNAAERSDAEIERPRTTA